jgi:hypothetical protein
MVTMGIQAENGVLKINLRKILSPTILRKTLTDGNRDLEFTCDFNKLIDGQPFPFVVTNFNVRIDGTSFNAICLGKVTKGNTDQTKIGSMIVYDDYFEFGRYDSNTFTKVGTARYERDGSIVSLNAMNQPGNAKRFDISAPHQDTKFYLVCRSDPQQQARGDDNEEDEDDDEEEGENGGSIRPLNPGVYYNPGNAQAVLVDASETGRSVYTYLEDCGSDENHTCLKSLDRISHFTKAPLTPPDRSEYGALDVIHLLRMHLSADHSGDEASMNRRLTVAGLRIGALIDRFSAQTTLDRPSLCAA